MRTSTSSKAGFSLIEVVITLGILMSLTIAVASMLRSGFDVKQGLSQRAKVMHRLQVAIGKMSDDVQHTFFISTKDQARNGIGRRTKGIFKLDKQTNADKLSLTTKTHRAQTSGSYESDTTYVVYELRDAKDSPGRKDLYRGETKVIPEDLKEDPPMRLLAPSIKSLNIECWNGERWMKNDYWDTGRGDTRNLLPKLVRINIEAYKEDRVEGDGQDETADEGTELISTVVYLSDSWEYAEPKSQNSSIKWDQM